MKKNLLALVLLSIFSATAGAEGYSEGEKTMKPKDWIIDGVIVAGATAVGSPTMGVLAAGYLAYNEGAFESMGMGADKSFLYDIKMESDMPKDYYHVSGWMMNFAKGCQAVGLQPQGYSLVYDDKGWKTAIAQGNYRALSQNGVRDANGIITNGDTSKPDFTDELANRKEAKAMLKGGTYQGMYCLKTVTLGNGQAVNVNQSGIEFYVDLKTNKFIVNQYGTVDDSQIVISVEDAIRQGKEFKAKYQSGNF